MKKPYHCVWPPFSDSRPHISYTSITAHEVTFAHIRLYELSLEDSLSSFLSFLESLSSIPSTIAIVLINTEESYDLEERFNAYRGETPVPIVVVKRKAGLGLKTQLERYPRKVEARIQGEEEEEGREEVAIRRDSLGKTKERGQKNV